MKFHKNNFVSLCLFCWILFSCTNIQNVDIEKVDYILVDGEKLNTVLPDTAIVDKLWTVQLETNDDVLINNCYKTIIYNQRIIVFDRTQQVIFIFDIKGNFIAKIDKQGKGPGEYIQIEEVFINKSGRIVLHDAPKKENIIFSIDGEYLDKKKTYVDVFINQMELENGDYAYYTGQKYNENEKIRNSSITIVSDNKFNYYLPNHNDVEIKIRTSDGYLFKGGAEIYFYKPFSPIIYQITNDNHLISRFYIRFKNGGLPTDIYQTCYNTKHFMEQYYNNDKYLLIPGSITATDNYLIIPIVSAGKMEGCVWYSIKTRKTIQARGFRTPYYNFPINFTRCTYGDTLISIIDDYFIKLSKTPIDYDDKNPKIVFYTLKDF